MSGTFVISKKAQRTALRTVETKHAKKNAAIQAAEKEARQRLMEERVLADLAAAKKTMETVSAPNIQRVNSISLNGRSFCFPDTTIDMTKFWAAMDFLGVMETPKLKKLSGAAKPKTKLAGLQYALHNLIPGHNFHKKMPRFLGIQ